jgi:hypothetical protein
VNTHSLWGDDFVYVLEIGLSDNFDNNLTKECRPKHWDPIADRVDKVVVLAFLNDGRFAQRLNQLVHVADAGGDE